MTFFRNNDKREIDLLLDRDGVLYPVEVKQIAAPRPDDTKNFRVIDPVASDEVTSELASFKRAIGTGCVLCMAMDTYPVNSRAWAFPVWAV